jgi:hypothetical protein
VNEELDETDVVVDVTDVTEVDVAGIDVVVVENVLVVVVLVEYVVVRGGVVRLNGPKIPVAGEATSADSAKTETTTTTSWRTAECRCLLRLALLNKLASSEPSNREA